MRHGYLSCLAFCCLFHLFSLAHKCKYLISNGYVSKQALPDDCKRPSDEMSLSIFFPSSFYVYLFIMFIDNSGSAFFFGVNLLLFCHNDMDGLNTFLSAYFKNISCLNLSFN